MEHATPRLRPLVLIAEDDESILDLLHEVLSDEGYQTVGCRNSEDTYRCIRKQQPDLVMLDVHLHASADGFALLDIIRSTPATAEIPVILCSADLRFLQDKAYEVQVSKCAVLEKPFDIDDLVATVKQALVAPPQTKRRSELAARMQTTTLRATKRLTAPRAVRAAVTSMPPPSDSSNAFRKERDTGQPSGIEGMLSSLICVSRQLSNQSQLICAHSLSIRNQTAQIIQELWEIEGRIDYSGWMEAMSGPQARWLWRRRESSDERVT